MFARSWPVVFVVAALAFTACTQSSTQTASNSPEQSPSASQGASPSASPSSSPSATSSPTSSPTSTPTAAPGKLTASLISFHAGEVGVGYGAVALGASGGTPPYTWSLKSGSLPSGLGLSQGGVISGTPTAAGKPNFTVGVTDSAGGSASLNGSINIFPHLAVTAPCANQCSVEEGCTVCGAFGSATGGQSPYKFTVTVNNIPPGMKVSGLTLTGTFPAPGPLGQYNASVVVTDQQGVQATVVASWFVFSHIAFTTTSGVCNGTYLSPCSAVLYYAGGTPGASPSVTVSPDPKLGVPGGMTVTAANGQVVITVQAHCGNVTPCGGGYGIAVITLVLRDQSVCGAGGAKCTSGPASVSIYMQAG